MRHMALFNGIGGFQLASHWMGWENVCHCEIDPFCNAVVKKHFPNSICYEDIKTFDANEWRGKIDIISGGFPCQPFSQAGKRKGTDDNRYLWPEMLRIIGEVQPRFIVGENVSGIINWDGGLVFEQVQADLEAQGYESQAYVLPACAVNAPHKRDRVWFIAHDNCNRNNWGTSNGDIKEESEQKRDNVVCKTSGSNTQCSVTNATDPRIESLRSGGEDEIHEPWIITDSNDQRIQGWPTSGNIKSERAISEQYPRGHNQRNDWNQFPTQSPVCNGDDGFSSQLDGITFSKWRNESIKAGGNAIVPQVAFEISKAIEACQ